MFTYLLKILLVTLIFPFLIIFLNKDCTHPNRNSDNQSNEANKKMDSVQTGMWAGKNIVLNLDDGGAQIDYACGHGSIDEKIIPDANGYFNAKGIHIREHGGPILLNEPSGSHPAQYSGQIKDNTMSLIVTETDTKELVGKFALVYGQKTRLVKCY